MMVDNHGFLIDLSGIKGTLVDPTILQVEWGMLGRGGETREGGLITRQDGSKQPFFDKALLKPYLDAWTARRAELLAPSPVEVHTSAPA